MLPFKKILCPTDFSEPACRAIVAAGEVAEHFKAELILIHVVGVLPVLESPTGAPGFDIATYQAELMKSAQRSLDERRALRIPASVPTRTMVTLGDAAHEIARVAEEEGVDLIVVASHGTSGRRLRFFGSVAEKVVRIARCSVLTIRCSEPGA
jgi:nucleotide-binding universal stress UspA family protein